MNYAVTAGKTSHILPVKILDSSSTTGALLGGVAAGDLTTTYYWRSSAAAPVAIALDGPGTVGTYTANKFREVDAARPGLYQLCIPDAAFASGADYVTVFLDGAPDMVPVMFTVPIRAFSQDTAGVSIATGGIVAASFAANSIPNTAFPSDGTAQAGGASSITLASGASAVNDHYQHQSLGIVRGTGAGQTNRVSTYNGGTKVATMVYAWKTVPDNTSEYAFDLSTSVLVDAIGATAVTSIVDGVDGSVIEVEGSITRQAAESVNHAILAGRSSNNGSTFATPNNAATRSVSTVDVDGNRTAVTLTPSA